MKPMFPCALLAALACAPAFAQAPVEVEVHTNSHVGASVQDDYARQWPLVMQDEAGVWRVALEPGVYRSAHSADLSDVDVIDAAGVPVPTTLFQTPVPVREAGQVELRWFPLPPRRGGRTDAVSLDIERNADGSLRRVGTTLAVTVPTDDGGNGWLLDASAIDDRIVALELDWAQAQPFEARYRVEGSDDLREWSLLQPGAALLDLLRDGERLRHRRIPLDTRKAYLRLTPVEGDIGALSSVRAELAPTSTAPTWQWQESAGQRVEVAGRAAHEFVLDGRFPVERADVALPGSNAGIWTLYSRDDPAQPWQRRAGPWVSYRIDDGADGRSEAQPLAHAVRDRYWKLETDADRAQAPVLLLGWRSEVLVFVAQGKPPFRLVAGSARVQRADAPLQPLLASMRERRGEHWQPATATLGEAAMLAGDSALHPKPPSRDWKHWLLWGVLILGALLVAGFAFSLLRSPARPE